MSTTDISSYYQLFLQTARDHIAAINLDLSRLDTSNKKDVLDEIYRRTHSLKGSSSIMGITEIATICEEIDNAINNSDPNTTLPQLSHKLIKLSSEIDDRLAILEKNGKVQKPI